MASEAWCAYDAGSEFREYLHSRGKPNGGAAASDEQEPPWPELAPQALHGLAGEVVAAIDPHTEADPAAVLVHFLVGFGNLIGREPHFRVGGTEHHTNLFACFVGATAAGRKGSAWGEVQRLLRLADPEWAQDRIAGGLSSGEGVIWAVRDPGEDADMDENGDQGAADKRLLILEPEFAAPLRIMEREGNTLSAIIRQAWDSGTLRVLTKRNPVRATDAHISIIGHITRDELLRYLNSTELGNGFANRFLWLAVRRSKLLPDGGCLPENDVLRLADRIGRAAQSARDIGEVRRDEEARLMWHAVYGALTAGRTGLFGAVTSRAEAQTMRLAMLYAVLDGSATIRADHLRAGLALWQYCEDSARWIFGQAMGDPVADAILSALRAAPEGLSRTDIRDLFGRNQTAARINASLRALQEAGLARAERVESGGRPAERWFATQPGG